MGHKLKITNIESCFLLFHSIIKVCKNTYLSSEIIKLILFDAKTPILAETKI